MIYGWSPRLGDPDLLGQVTVVAYFLSAALCLGAARASPGRRDVRRLWAALTLAMVALGINKQLDLQSLLTAVGRHMAQVGHWYEYRRLVQVAFIATLALAGTGSALWLVGRLRRLGRPARVAGLGCAMLLTFVAIRAASFHHVDALLSVHAEGLKLNHVLELGGIAIIGVGALMEIVGSKTPRS